MDQKPWLKSYPPGVPHEIDPEQYTSVTQLLEESFRKHAGRPFSVCMERWMTYRQVDELSKALGACCSHGASTRARSRHAAERPAVCRAMRQVCGPGTV